MSLIFAWLTDAHGHLNKCAISGATECLELCLALFRGGMDETTDQLMYA